VNCPFVVNISCRPHHPFPYFTKIRTDHNHNLDINPIFLAKWQPEFTEELEKIALIGRSTSTQAKAMLENRFPEHPYFNDRKVSNIMQQARTDHIEEVTKHGGEIAMLVNDLESKRRREGWDYAQYMNPETQTLSRLWWIDPDQQILLKKYGSVLLLDVSEGRNIYDYYLTTFVIIDGENRSFNVAYCVHEKQDTETFAWTFRHMDLHLPQGDVPRWTKFEVLFSNRDEAMANAARQVWDNSVFHGICLWHLQRNIDQRLANWLPNYADFKKEFWNVYMAPSPRFFHVTWHRFMTMLSQHDSARRYMENEIYPDRERWAWAWIGSRFMAGIRTTGRLKVQHNVYKQLGIGRWTTLSDLFEELHKRSQKQQLDAEYKFQLVLINLSPLSFP